MSENDLDDVTPGAESFEQPEWFDEAAYLLANPDVLESVAAGEFPSAYHHYVLHGRKERRPLFGNSAERRNCLVRSKPISDDPIAQVDIRCSIEVLMISPRGAILIVGWIDDLASPLELIRLRASGWHITLTASRLARFRRSDVEQSLHAGYGHSFGFFAFVYAGEALGSSACSVSLRLSDGTEYCRDVNVRVVSEIEIRDTVLSYVSTCEVYGNRQVEAARMLCGPLGDAIINHNKDISKELVAGAYVETFGPRKRKRIGSLVVCLYGKPEYLFLQSALFSGNPGFEDYEMIYVSNSPEMAEQLVKDMRIAQIVYEIPQTLVLLPGNAGFGAANNLAVQSASTNRVLIVNPDIFPRDHDWARKHTEVVATMQKSQTQLFGVPLYYDDGSLMHGGMYFDFDSGLSVDKTAMTSRRMVRVEHYGKGTPAWLETYTKPRPVPAVTGAFMSIDRGWFERLGGFTEDYVFGHYEDADLCLKSIASGVAPWIHDVRLWHLEGKGSARSSVHDGGSHLNRGIFSERWGSTISAGLEGPKPTHPLLDPHSRASRAESRLGVRDGTSTSQAKTSVNDTLDDAPRPRPAVASVDKPELNER